MEKIQLKRWFLIRADANKTIGLGHVMRCLALSEWATDFGLIPILISREHNTFIKRKLESLGGTLIVIDGKEASSNGPYQHSHWLGGNELDDAHMTVKVLKTITNSEGPPTFVVVDHYALGREWEKILSQYAPILAIDDLSDRPHECHILLDQTLGKEPKEYRGLVPKNCTILTSTQFALLRKEFSISKAQTLGSSSRRVAIALGGTDENNFSGDILRQLLFSKDTQNIEYTLITSSMNPNLRQLNMEFESFDNLELKVDANNISEILAEQDLCIGAAGSSAWERCALGLPTIMFILAANQTEVAHSLHNYGAAILLGDITQLPKLNLPDNLSQVLNDEVALKRIKHNCLSLIDGRGSERVMREIIKISSASAFPVSLRKARQTDIDFVYRLQCFPETRRFARNPNIPDFESHVNWMKTKLQSNTDAFNIIVLGASKDCGVVRLDKLTEAKYEISIYIDPVYFGLGLASRAIQKALNEHSGILIVATVLPENEASKKLFSSLGFTQQNASEYHYRT